MKNHFSRLHPAVTFLFFTLVIVFSMVFMHPVMLGISLAGAFAFGIMLSGKKTARFSLFFLLPLMILTAVLNPLFNHEGVTILFYARSGNPVTLESVLYGAAAAFMLAAVVSWFSCYNKVMTSDKFIYLFGRVCPALSLVLSMALRFVPRYKRQAEKIFMAQLWLSGGKEENELPQEKGQEEGLKRQSQDVGWKRKTGRLRRDVGRGMRIFSILVTWALENAVETADSMKSRGYGLPGRTSFSMWRFDFRDGLLFGAECVLGGVVFFSWLLGGIQWTYFPFFYMGKLTLGGAVGFAAYAVLCFLPVIVQLGEEIRWNYIKSGI